MNIRKITHNLSHFKWLFLIAAIILIVYSFIDLPENLLSLIGLIIFITGIYLGLDSLADVEKMSKKEKDRYINTQYSKIQYRIVLIAIIVLVLISIMFLSLKFIFSNQQNELFNDFFDLGLNCWALILGCICLLKSISDKHTHANA